MFWGSLGFKPVRKKESVRTEAALPELGWGARGPRDCPESQAIHSHLTPAGTPPKLGAGPPSRARSSRRRSRSERSAGEGRAPHQRGQWGRSLVTLGNRPDDTAPRPRTPCGLPLGLSSQGRKRQSPQQLRPRLLLAVCLGHLMGGGGGSLGRLGSSETPKLWRLSPETPAPAPPQPHTVLGASRTPSQSSISEWVSHS